MNYIISGLVLPPVGLVLLVLVLAAVMWRARSRRRAGLAIVLLASLMQLGLATPLVAGLLTVSLEHVAAPAPTGEEPGAIIVLAAEVSHSPAGPDIGPLTLERLRAAVALHRRTGLPMLVTGGPLSPGEEAVAVLMARSLAADFQAPARWVEPLARDTWENAAFSARLLDQSGIHAAYVVTHAWHMGRAFIAFARSDPMAAKMQLAAAPVRIDRAPNGAVLSDWVPRADRWAESWFAIHEWAGRVVYALRT